MAGVKEGRGIKPSARAAGIGKQTGRRWLREAFVELREEGLSVSAAQAALGYASPLMEQWDRQRSEHRNARHHLALGVAVEQAFWDCFETGGTVSGASLAVGVGRSTGYRWWRARFDELHGQGVTVRVAAHRLRGCPCPGPGSGKTSGDGHCRPQTRLGSPLGVARCGTRRGMPRNSPVAGRRDQACRFATRAIGS